MDCVSKGVSERGQRRRCCKRPETQTGTSPLMMRSCPSSDVHRCTSTSAMLSETSLGACKGLGLASGVVPPHLAALRLFHLRGAHRKTEWMRSSLRDAPPGAMSAS